MSCVCEREKRERLQISPLEKVENMPVAVITGASSGIGAAIARALLEQGWKVALVARRKQRMQQICHSFEQTSYLICSADFSQNSQTIAAVNEISKWIDHHCESRLDLLVNNAGALTSHDSLQLQSVPTFERILRVNVSSAFIFTAGLKPWLIRSESIYENQPSVVMIGSMAGIAPFTEDGLYCVTKAAVHHLGRVASMELGSSRIRVNILALAEIESEVLIATGMSETQSHEYFKNARFRYPMGRIGTVDDAVQMILFLSDPNKSGWMTDQTIVMDGAMLQGNKEYSQYKL